MCGINLCFGRDPEALCRMNYRTEELGTLHRMNDQMKHRGFRTQVRSYFDQTLRLGHVRLPILGMSEDHDHPLKRDCMDGAMVGEVLNFRDFQPDAVTDMAMVLRRWVKHGVESLKDYDGFWAMVFVNKCAKTLTVVTDPLGKKPLYMRTDPRTAISSEIAPLLEAGPVTTDETYFSGVSKWGYCPDRSTPYNEIKMISPGKILVLDHRANVLSFESYMSIQPKRGNLMALMEDAVRNRLVSDIPVSLLLSGGLDSTIVFELMKRHTRDFTVFHVDNDESEFLNHLDLKNIRVVPITLGNADLREILIANQTPVDLGSVIPQFKLGRVVREHGFSVTLSGDGADELFGGYRRAKEYDSQRSDVFHELVYYHLPRLDRLMMASRVELRCPFLSLPVVAHALSLPWDRRRNKEELKEVFGGIVPRAILDREKKPLKVEGIRGDNKMAWRKMMVRVFREMILSERTDRERE